MGEENIHLRWQSIAIVLVASLALTAWFVLHSRLHTLQLKAYFSDVHSLHAGAPVSIAGVTVGSVASVRIRPELRDNPAEVILSLNTPYELTIPSDATVSVASAGLLGEQYAVIDIRNASGPTARDGATLKTVPSQEITAQQLADCLNKLANHQSCDLVRTRNDVTGPERK